MRCLLLLWLAACQQGESSSKITPPPKPIKPAKVHRSTAPTACPQRPPGTGSGHPSGPETDNPHTCSTDADCITGKNGRCMRYEHSFRGTHVGSETQCTYDGCTSDADCPKDSACLCAGELPHAAAQNTCIVIGCKTDSDCGDYRCSPTFQYVPNNSCRSEGETYTALRCHTPDDECVDDTDCQYKDCAFDPAKQHWACNIPVCMPD